MQDCISCQQRSGSLAKQTGKSAIPDVASSSQIRAFSQMCLPALLVLPPLVLRYPSSFGFSLLLLYEWQIEEIAGKGIALRRRIMSS